MQTIQCRTSPSRSTVFISARYLKNAFVEGGREKTERGTKSMNKDTLQNDWKQLRSAVRQRWGALTDNDLDTVAVKPDQLPGLLEARYGYTRDQAEMEIDLFLSNMKLEGKNPVEVVRETLSDSSPEEEAHVDKRVPKE